MEVRAYSTSAERLRGFAERVGERIGMEIRPVASAREAVDGADIVACATNSHDPVIDATWLAPGQHVGSVQSHEIGTDVLERATAIVVRDLEVPTFHHPPGNGPVEALEIKRLEPHLAAKLVELGAVIRGRPARRAPDDVTLFTGGGMGASSGLGIQFAAAGHAVYQAARKAGLGRELPTEWFTETAKP